MAVTTPRELASLRGRIDEIDGRLLELLARRRALALETLGVKSRHGLFAIDAGSGRPCPDFGRGGEVDLRVGIGETRPGEYYMTSPPFVPSPMRSQRS